MKSFDYDAVEYDGDIYCIDCLPDGISVDNEDVSPIFADSEWDYAPVCCVCNTVHDYVSIITAEGNMLLWEHNEDEVTIKIPCQYIDIDGYIEIPGMLARKYGSSRWTLLNDVTILPSDVEFNLSDIASYDCDAKSITLK